MSQAWGLCPKCGKVIPLDPVDFPKQPPELLRHLEEHREKPTAKEAEPERPLVPSSSPSSLEAFQAHGGPRAISSRPHGRPAHRPTS